MAATAGGQQALSTQLSSTHCTVHECPASRSPVAFETMKASPLSLWCIVIAPFAAPPPLVAPSRSSGWIVDE